MSGGAFYSKILKKPFTKTIDNLLFVHIIPALAIGIVTPARI